MDPYSHSPYYQYNGYRDDRRDYDDYDMDTEDTDSGIINVHMHPTHSGLQFYLSQYSPGNEPNQIYINVCLSVCIYTRVKDSTVI